MVQWLRLQAPGAGGPGSIPGGGSRSHMLQLRPCAAKQIDIHVKKKKRPGQRGDCTRSGGDCGLPEGGLGSSTLSSQEVTLRCTHWHLPGGRECWRPRWTPEAQRGLCCDLFRMQVHGGVLPSALVQQVVKFRSTSRVC